MKTNVVLGILIKLELVLFKLYLPILTIYLGSFHYVKTVHISQQQLHELLSFPLLF